MSFGSGGFGGFGSNNNNQSTFGGFGANNTSGEYTLSYLGRLCDSPARCRRRCAPTHERRDALARTLLTRPPHLQALAPTRTPAASSASRPTRVAACSATTRARARHSEAEVCPSLARRIRVIILAFLSLGSYAMRDSSNRRAPPSTATFQRVPPLVWDFCSSYVVN